jgi:hypothetical protein
VIRSARICAGSFFVAIAATILPLISALTFAS